MHARQIKKVNMYLLLKMYLDQVSLNTIQSMYGFEDYLLSFTDYVALLKDQYELQELQIGGYSNTKITLRNHMVELAIDTSNKLYAYAISKGDQNLAAEVKYTLTSIDKHSDAQCVTICEIIYEKAEEFIAELGPFFVTVISQGELNGAIAAFVAVMPSPKFESNIKKMATEEINILFNKCDEVVTKMDVATNVMMKIVPNYYKEYYLNRRVSRPSYRMLAARLRVLDAEGNALSNVVVECKELKLKRRTSQLGQILMRNAPDGVYIVRLSRSELVSKEFEIAIVKGERMDYTITMEFKTLE